MVTTEEFLIIDCKLNLKSDSASSIFPLLFTFLSFRTDCKMWLDSYLENYLPSFSPTHTNSLTSASKAQLLGGSAFTAQTPLFLSACAIKRPYSVDSAYRQSLVAEPTVVPSSGPLPPTNMMDASDLSAKAVGGMERRDPAGRVVLRYCCRGATESRRYTCEQLRSHTREQSRRAGFTMKMLRLNTCWEERQLYANQKTICTQEEMRHLGFCYPSQFTSWTCRSVGLFHIPAAIMRVIFGGAIQERPEPIKCPGLKKKEINNFPPEGSRGLH